MRSWILTVFVFLMPTILFSQEEEHLSIHRYELKKYQSFGEVSPAFYDSVHNFQILKEELKPKSELVKRVFGYHPYWGASNYLNYQWDLLSDLCYFSYEVDPSTGLPITTHDWETSAAIDSALANGVKVHLCVTLFSGHGTFFSNPGAQQTLIDQIILLISSRSAHGVNMDIEALPSIYKEEFLEFMIALCDQMNQELPEAEVSIAAPAVNWSDKFNVPILNEYLDFFMVMGYDYYWNGSSMAGPVSPLYPMISYYTYCFSRTISYYQSQGVSAEKIIMGVPYYAYQWKTEGQYAPSSTIGSGSAYTYRNIMDNTSGHYAIENKHMEPNSFGPYYSFESNGWNQCFLDDVYSLGEKYDIINRRNLAGVGIWALGYDNGYPDLWDLLAEKFTAGSSPVNADTIYDTGGPSFDYYDDEIYNYTLSTAPGSKIYLSFSYLDTEENYDTLWIYDGADTTASLIGIFSGNYTPELIPASSNKIMLKFYSDEATVDAGWRAVYDTLPVSEVFEANIVDLKVWPNPAHHILYLEYSPVEGTADVLHIVDNKGVIYEKILLPDQGNTIQLNLSRWEAGIYFVSFMRQGKAIGTRKILVK